MTTESSDQITFIHSLVTLSISDQWTRARVQNDGTIKVAGALLGKQSGRNIEIINTFEVHSINVGGILQLDEEFFNGREVLFKETFPDLEFLGFYITGDHTRTDEQDVSIQKQAMKFSESPYLLKFNTEKPVICDKLSLGVFDSIVNPATEQMVFHSIPVKIVSELSEQIGLDHVARFSKTGNTAESTASKYLSAQFGAMGTLLQGVNIAHEYVKAVREGKVERDEVLLKDIQKLCQKLCETKANALSEQEAKQASDKKLMMLLCAMTDVQGSLYELITKLNLLSSERFSVGPSHSSSGMNPRSRGFYGRQMPMMLF
jgi:COP9 signalosome complex subunit 6